MDNNMIIAAMNLLMYIGPIVLVVVGALIYDRIQKRKTRPNGNYKCSNCGFIFPQKTAIISGFESHRYGLHINCPQCGATVEQFIKP